MNNITVTVELCKQDRDRLDAILYALKASAVEPQTAPEPQKEQPQATSQAPAKKAAAPKAEPVPVHEKLEPVDALPWEEPKKAEAKAEPEVTLEDIQASVVELCNKKGKKQETRDIIFAYAGRVSEIPKDKYSEVLHKLRALALEA